MSISSGPAGTGFPLCRISKYVSCNFTMLKTKPQGLWLSPNRSGVIELWEGKGSGTLAIAFRLWRRVPNDLLDKLINIESSVVNILQKQDIVADVVERDSFIGIKIHPVNTEKLSEYLKQTQLEHKEVIQEIFKRSLIVDFADFDPSSDDKMLDRLFGNDKIIFLHKTDLVKFLRISNAQKKRGRPIRKINADTFQSKLNRAIQSIKESIRNSLALKLIEIVDENHKSPKIFIADQIEAFKISGLWKSPF